ncbi:MAG: hypothetical protein ACRDL7_04995, partial [Gaiellaceae bacterium]
MTKSNTNLDLTTVKPGISAAKSDRQSEERMQIEEFVLSGAHSGSPLPIFSSVGANRPAKKTWVRTW